MAIRYDSGAGTITITDSIGNRLPIVLNGNASAEEVNAAIDLYHPPTPPEPQWVGFGGAMQASAAIKELLFTAFQQRELPLALGLAVGLYGASDGKPESFLNSWAMASSIEGLISPELAAEVKTLAQQFDIPAEFVAALQPS